MHAVLYLNRWLLFPANKLYREWVFLFLCGLGLVPVSYTTFGLRWFVELIDFLQPRSGEPFINYAWKDVGLSRVDIIEDFLCKLGMKPHTYASSGYHHFSLYHVIVRSTKIINNLIDHKIKVIFQCWKSVESFCFIFQILRKLWFFKYIPTLFSKKMTFFVGSFNNFGRSDDDMISQKMMIPNLLVAYVVSYPTWTKNLEWYLI